MKITLTALLLLTLVVTRTAAAVDLNAACAALSGSLAGTYSASLQYPNGAADSLNLTFIQQGPEDFTVTLNGDSEKVKLANATLSGHDSCIIQGDTITLTQLAVPSIYDANVNGVVGVMTLQKGLSAGTVSGVAGWKVVGETNQFEHIGDYTKDSFVLLRFIGITSYNGIEFQPFQGESITCTGFLTPDKGTVLVKSLSSCTKNSNGTSSTLAQ